MTGVFVAFEGPHGAGKSTILNLTHRALEEKGYRVAVTKEPTNSKLGRLAREQDGTILDSVAYFFLILADRYEHGRELRELQGSHDFVLCDRYTGSSLVLNGLRGVPISLIEAAHARALRPDTTIIISARPERLRERMTARPEAMTAGERLTSREDEYHAYNALADAPSNILGRTILVSNDGDSPAFAVDRVLEQLEGLA